MAEPRLLTRTLRRLGRLVAWFAIPWAAAVAFGMNPSTPVDLVMNAWPVPFDATLVAPRDGARHLVVLQHGLWRSAAAMGRLERVLLAHGYEVLNTSYPSTACRIEEHAALLRSNLEARLARADSRPLRLHFVGHSMGGLVIRAYLARPDARTPASVVFLGTPQKGAMLSDLRRAWWPFRVLMGERAASQLSPSHAFPHSLPPSSWPFATIAGGLGDAEGRNASIPGDDDGTVAVAETELAGASASLLLPIGHTRLSFSDAVLVPVLRFLTLQSLR